MPRSVHGRGANTLSKEEEEEEEEGGGGGGGGVGRRRRQITKGGYQEEGEKVKHKQPTDSHKSQHTQRGCPTIVFIIYTWPFQFTPTLPRAATRTGNASHGHTARAWKRRGSLSE